MPLKTVFNNNYFINKKNFVLTNKKTRKGRPFKKTGTCFLSIKIIYRPEKSRETIPLSHTVLAVYIYSAGCLTPLNILKIKFCGYFLCLLQNWYLPQILHCITHSFCARFSRAHFFSFLLLIPPHLSQTRDQQISNQKFSVLIS